MPYVKVKRGTLRLMIDALYAARTSGLKLSLEQMVFDRCIAHAGGMARLETLLGPEQKKDTDDV